MKKEKAHDLTLKLMKLISLTGNQTEQQEIIESYI